MAPPKYPQLIVSSPPDSVIVEAMAEVVYVSNARLERRQGPLRLPYLPGEERPVTFSVHGGIAKHYGVDEKKLGESHAATIDYVVAATAG